MRLDSKKRFSDRVEYYIKYRPRYPAETIDFLKGQLNLSPSSIVADVGAGTGILTELFLKHGNPVFAIEPNQAMRQAAERLLSHYPNFTGIEATAEATTLPENSVDFVTAAQAFHWFEIDQTRLEFGRIVRPGGWVIVIVNAWRKKRTPFLDAYEQVLLDFSLESRLANHHQIDDRLQKLFGHYQSHTLDNYQTFDYKGLKGRVLSSSYMPLAGHPKHEPMLDALRQVFEAHQQAGHIRFDYETHLYYGQLKT